MKILMITRFYLNGQTTHVFSLCKELIRQGHQVFLIACYLDKTIYLRQLNDLRIPFSTAPKPIRLRSFLENKGFDLIHTHSAHTLAQSLELGKHLRVPVVSTCHYLGFPLADKLVETDAIIVISPEMKESYAFPEEKTFIIQNGVEIPPNANTSLGENYHALILTRMTERKRNGFQNFVTVVNRLNWRVTSVGNWTPPQGVTRVPWTTDTSPFLKQADVVVGTGRAIREGLAAGCVGIVLGEWSDGVVTPDNVDLLARHNFSGRATKTRPSLPYWESLAPCFTDESILSLKKFGREYAQKNFGIDKMTKETIRVYRNVLSKGV